MATESPVRIIESTRTGKWASSKDSASFGQPLNNLVEDELSLLLKGHTISGEQRNMVPNRSGSAPPSMEGSYAAFGNVMYAQRFTRDSSFTSGSSIPYYQTGEQLQGNPSTSAHSSSNPNLLQFSQSIMSRDGLHHIGALSNNWKLTSSSGGSGDGALLLPRSSLSTHQEEPEDDSSPGQASDDWAERSNSIYPEQNILSLAGRHRSLVDLIQADFPRTPSPVYNQSRSSSLVTTDEPIDPDIQVQLDNLSIKIPISPETTSGLDSGVRVDNSLKLKAIDGPSIGSLPKPSYSMSNERDKQEKVYEKNVLQPYPQQSHYQVQGFQDFGSDQSLGNAHNGFGKILHGHTNFSSAEVQSVLQTTGITPPLYAATAAYMASGNQFYSNYNPTAVYSQQYSMGGYPIGSTFIPPYVAGYPSHAGLPMHYDASSRQSFSGQTAGVSTGESNQQMQYFQHPLEDAYIHQASYGRAQPINMVGGQFDSYVSQKDPNHPSYIGDKKFQCAPSGNPAVYSPRRVGLTGSNYYGNPTGIGFMPPYLGSPLGSPVIPGSPVGGATLSGRRNEFRFPQASIRSAGEYSNWQDQRGSQSFNDPKKHSFLEELRANNARKIELSDITGRIVEFSVDQHGSRFIQQKLENCSVEDKVAVFREVLPHASKLMTDVFGNYVIQKFFEHGDPEQRKELADQLSGQILPLSLQMYGCRVIQKALDVIDLDQKRELVYELDGHVMRCVRDQNGNHVIQKCIECVPTNEIGFIISAFQGQVATLSTHPYGCRVIQRVLEHCSDNSETQCIVDEILESAFVLAQDQYGNYVTQHVLEKGKPHERSQIISKLAGKVVQMSQHKYASNVVEKCLEYADAVERETLIEEILAQPEENDSLLAMMKDQFANYVVQKILEISNDKQREILLNRIRAHLHALKKYTYGKHIVARFEQLSGEESGSSEP